MLEFVLIPFVLFVYAFPLGYLVFRQFREKPNVIYSFIFGLGIFVLVLFWAMLINFNFILITFVVLIIDFALLLRLWRLGIKFLDFDFGFGKYLFLFFLLLFVYYSIVPLFVQYSYYRDYDLIALGIQENSALELPWYNIKTFYTPGGSLLVAFLNLMLPYSLNKIMLNLSYLFMFLLFITLYLLGKEMKDALLGFFICLSFLLSASSKNFIWDGATFPGITSTLLGLMAFAFLLRYAKDKKRGCFLFSAIPLAASALTHIDSVISILWVFLAALIIFRNKRMFHFIIGVGVISLLLVSPFILNSLKAKADMEKLWTGKFWEDFANDEIHPKALDELFFYNGWPIFIFSLIGVGYLIWQKKFLFPLWLFFLFLSNSTIFLYIAKPFVLFYAINIIMWFGLGIPLTITAGYGLQGLYAKIPYKTLFIILVLALSLLVLFDYETFNKLNVYRRWSTGNLLWAFDNEMHYLNKGDLELADWAKNNADGLILNPNNFAGQAFPILSKKQTMQYFYHIFYDELSKQGFMQQRDIDARAILLDTNPLLIGEYGIKFIYLPSSIDSNSEYNASILEKYAIIKRSRGAKLLLTESRVTKLKHYEAEDYLTNGKILDISETGMTLKAVALPQQTGIQFKIYEKFSSEKIRIYIKHSSYFKPFPFVVRIGDFVKEVKQTTFKPTFVESVVEIDRRLLEKNKGILEIVSQAPVYGVWLKNYFLIVDWIEVEEV